MRKYISVVLCLMITLIIVGCGSGGEEKSQKVGVCKSSNEENVHYKYEFVLDDDEKIIKEIRFVQTVDENYLKNVAIPPEDEPNMDIKEMYIRFRDDMQYQYDMLTEGIEDFDEWYKAKIEKNDEKLFSQLTFTFDVSNEKLKEKLKVEDEETIMFLMAFGVNMFYDFDEKAFLYEPDRFLSKVPIKNIPSSECKIIEEK